MVHEIEHEAGTSDAEIKDVEMEYKKNLIAQSLNITRAKLDEHIETVKDFFNLNRKEIERQWDNNQEALKREVNNDGK